MPPPEARLVPVLLDRQTQGRESIAGGLVRAILALLFGGGRTPQREVHRQINAVTRTAVAATQGLSWVTHDVIAGEPTRRPPDLEALALRDLWTERKVEELTRQAAEMSEALLADVEREVTAILDDAAASATQAHGDATGVIGYRRVPHPELSKGGTCGLCIVASDRIYRRGNLRKIHERCGCQVVEVTAANDPGGALNDLELGDIYAASGAIGAADRSALSHVRVQYDEQGRLVITRRRTAQEEAAPVVTLNAGNQQRIADLLGSIAATYAATKAS